MSKRLIVTGGAGFIGSHLVEELCKKGHEVKVIDDLSVTRDNLPILIEAGAEFVEGTITDYKFMEKELQGYDCIFHLAAMNRAMKSIVDPRKSHEVNATGTFNVLEAARKNEVRKVIYTSSSSIYGLSDEFPRVESQTPMPGHPYAVGKLTGEHYCNVYNRLFNVKTVILRYFSIYGPRQRGDIEYAAVIAKFIKRLQNNEPLEVYGDGEQTRNFTYVKDAIDATILAMEAKEAVGKTFNVASDKNIRINHLITELEKCMGTKAEVNYVDPRPGDVKHNPANISLARRDLGFKLNYNFGKGLAETVEWFLSK